MQHSAIREPSEQVTVFVKTRSSNDECLVWELSNDGTYAQINYTPDIQDVDTNIYSTSITMPDHDCTLFLLFKNEPLVISVGSPDKFFVYYRVAAGQTVPYAHIADNGEEISSGDLAELTNGFYAHKVEGYDESIMIVDNRPFPVRIPYTLSSDCETSGNIKIEDNVWQLISIPVEGVKVKEYFVDRLAEKYSADPRDMISICTAYFGDEDRFRSYIPGVTNPSTSNNFPLVYTDAGHREITGFWVKTKDLSGVVPDVNDVVFDWSES